MKRGAGKQMRREDFEADEDGDHDDEVQEIGRFSVASEDTLKTRPIKQPVSRLAKQKQESSAFSGGNPFASAFGGAKPASDLPQPKFTQVASVTEEKPKVNPFAGFAFGTGNKDSGFTFGSTEKKDTNSGSGDKPAFSFGSSTPAASSFTFGGSGAGQAVSAFSSTPAKDSESKSTTVAFGGTPSAFGSTFKSMEPAKELSKDVLDVFGKSPSQKFEAPTTKPAAFSFETPSKAAAPASTSFSLSSSKAESQSDTSSKPTSSFAPSQPAKLTPGPSTGLFSASSSKSAEELKTTTASAPAANNTQGFAFKPITFGGKAAEIVKKTDNEKDYLIGLMGLNLSFFEALENHLGQVAVRLKPLSGDAKISKEDADKLSQDYSPIVEKYLEHLKALKQKKENEGAADKREKENQMETDVKTSEPQSGTTATSSLPSSGFSFSFSKSDEATESRKSTSETTKDSGFKFSVGSPTKASTPGLPAPTSAFKFSSIPIASDEKKPESDSAPAKFSFQTATTSTPSATPSFSFGQPSSTGASGTTPSFSFGQSASTTKEAENAGKPAFSFSFGSAAALNPNAPTFTPSFGTTAASTMNTGEEKAGEDEDGAAEAEGFVNERTEEQTELLKRGAGEEDETTLHEVRCKLFRMESAGSYKDLGINFLKVNKRKPEESDTKIRIRLLARQEGTGQVTLNVSLVPQVSCQYAGEKKKDLTLLVFEAGEDGTTKFCKYLVRTKDQAVAEPLKLAIESAVNELKE